MGRVARILLLALLIVGAFAAPALAQSENKAVTKLVEDFLDDGEVDPCKHSEADLKLTKKLITPDIEQYVPDMRELIDAALEARARGDCDKKTSAAQPQQTPTPTPSPTPTPEPEKSKETEPTSTATPTPTPTPTTTVVADPPAPVAASRPQTKDDGKITRVAAVDPANSQPAPVIWLFVVAGALVLTLMTLMTLRLTGRGEQASHAWGEAAWRAQGAWQTSSISSGSGARPNAPSGPPAAASRRSGARRR